MEVGTSLSYPGELYGKLHDAVIYRTRRDGKKFTRRQRGNQIILWRIA
jgi:hypothetical protein